MLEHIRALGYDLDSAILDEQALDENNATIVNIGGGKGGMLRQVTHSYPWLEP